MANEQDFTFMFNTDQFKNAVTEVTAGLNKVSGQAEKTFSKENVASMGMRFGAFSAIAMGAVRMLGNAISSVFNKIGQNIPEIGQTFSIVSDIFFRNFFYPLRKQLVPLLQALLDWTRNHRAMFLRWGQVVSNIFRVLVSLVKEVVHIFKEMGKIFSESIRRIFGDVPMNIEKAFNILLFKVTVVVQYILQILEPVLGKFAELLALVGEIGISFGKGWLDGFEKAFKLSDSMSMLAKSFERLGKAWDKIGPTREQIMKFFTELGRAMGTLSGSALTELAKSLTDIVDSISYLLELMNKIKTGEFKWSDLNPFSEENTKDKTAVDYMPWYVRGGIKGGKAILDQLTGGDEPVKTKDAIISGGKIIQPAPDDQIIATNKKIQNLSTSSTGGPRAVTINLNTSGSLNVTQGNAEQAGGNFVQGIGKQLYFEILDEMTAEGSF